MDVAAAVVAWCCVAVLGVVLGVSFVPASPQGMRRPASRWLIVAGLVGMAAQLVNIYVREQWAAFLFWAMAPILLGVVIAELRFWLRKPSA